MVTSRTPNTASNADASAPKANNHRIFSNNPEGLFSRYSIVFRRAVNFFPQAWHLKSRISACIPCLPYPTRAGVCSSAIP
jgi:hypothetical protein